LGDRLARHANAIIIPGSQASTGISYRWIPGVKVGKGKVVEFVNNHLATVAVFGLIEAVTGAHNACLGRGKPGCCRSGSSGLSCRGSGYANTYIGVGLKVCTG
jgi:hypothetical protein